MFLPPTTYGSTVLSASTPRSSVEAHSKSSAPRGSPSKDHLPPTSRTGQAVLSLVFLIGGIVVLVALTLAFLVTSFLNSTYGFQVGERAKVVAASGVYDALARLSRNKDLSSSGYSVPLGSDAAIVSVTQPLPDTGLVTIVSTATVLNRTRTVRAVVSRDSNTGQIVLTSWQQT